MKQFARTFLAAVLATASCLVGAAQHSICYEEEQRQSLPTGVWGCRDDAGGSCMVTPLTASGTVLGASVPGNPPGTYLVVQLPSAGTFAARIDFYDAAGAPSTSRICSINAVSPFGSRGAASQGAELAGFTSDASGLVSTGVWRLLSPTTASFNRVTVEVPADFVAVGGGAVGKESPYGALVTESYQSDTMGSSGVGNWRRWTAKTADLIVADPHRTTVYAIGMRIAGLAARDLLPLLKLLPQDGSPAIAAEPTNRATIPPVPPKVSGSFVPLSGGVAAFADSSNSLTLTGQYATVTAPALEPCPVGATCKVLPIIAWRVESTDHLVAHPGTVNTTFLGMPSTVVVAGTTYSVLSRYVSATSAVDAHPAVDVGGLRGYALTGIGADVAWRDPLQSPKSQPPGNLIWKLEPRPDLLGASVASKDHARSSPASITGYALGIKLVMK